MSNKITSKQIRAMAAMLRKAPAVSGITRSTVSLRVPDAAAIVTALEFLAAEREQSPAVDHAAMVAKLRRVDTENNKLREELAAEKAKYEKLREAYTSNPMKLEIDRWQVSYEMVRMERDELRVNLEKHPSYRTLENCNERQRQTIMELTAKIARIESTMDMCRAMMAVQDASDGLGPREVEMMDMFSVAVAASPTPGEYHD